MTIEKHEEIRWNWLWPLKISFWLLNIRSKELL